MVQAPRAPAPRDPQSGVRQPGLPAGPHSEWRSGASRAAGIADAPTADVFKMQLIHTRAHGHATRRGCQENYIQVNTHKQKTEINRQAYGSLLRGLRLTHYKYQGLPIGRDTQIFHSHLPIFPNKSHALLPSSHLSTLQPPYSVLPPRLRKVLGFLSRCRTRPSPDLTDTGRNHWPL